MAYLEKQIGKLPYGILKELADQLDIAGPRNWKALISVMPNEMYSLEQVSKFEMQTMKMGGSPSMALLTDLGQRCKTVQQLVVWLKKIKNDRALDILKYNEELEIIEQPRSQTVDVGGSVTLRCKATGYPTPQYQWIKDGVEMPDEINEELIFVCVTLNDSGKYMCIVFSGMDKKKSKAVELLVLPPPEEVEIIEQPESQTVNVGESVTIRCKATGYPTPQYQWIKDGTELPKGINEELTFDCVTLKDYGKYACIVFNRMNVKESVTVELLVLPSPEEVEIIKQPESQTVYVGESVTLRCKATGYPTPKYQWIKDGVELPEGINEELTFDCVTPKDNGKYACIVSNRISIKESVTVELLVLSLPEEVEIIEQPESQTVYVGESVTLRCKATGYPTPKYQWIKDGVELPEGINEELTFDCIMPKDNGKYACIVSNRISVKESVTVELLVLPSPDCKEGAVKWLYITSEMSVGRQMLSPWLEEKINSSKIPGLHWRDKEKKEFQVSWKKDAMLFKLWAEHTGEYREGEPEDPDIWRAMFIRALYAMPDVEEITARFIFRQKDPYRVFRFKEKAESGSKLQSKKQLSEKQSPDRLCITAPLLGAPRSVFLNRGVFAGRGSKLHSKKQLFEKQSPDRLCSRAPPRAAPRPVPQPTRRPDPKPRYDIPTPPARQIIRENPMARLIVRDDDMKRDPEYLSAEQLYDDVTSISSPGDGRGLNEMFYETDEKTYMAMQSAERPSEDHIPMNPEGDVNRDENASAEELYEDMEHDENPAGRLSPGDEELYVPMDRKGNETTAEKYKDLQPAERPSVLCMSMNPGVLPAKMKDNSPWKDTSIVSNIVTSEGGVVVRDSVKLVCPPGAVDEPVSVNITLEDPSKFYEQIVQKDLENDVTFAAPIINLAPSGHFFKKPLTLVTKFKTKNFKLEDFIILHGSKARDGKITWQDITLSSKIDETNAEVIVEIEHFSIITALVRFSRSTVIRTKEILSRLNLVAFNYTLSVLLNKSSSSSEHDELALLFVSQDIYHEQSYREDETCSALMQLKKEGFVELPVHSIAKTEEKSIYNNENLYINVDLGEDYKLVDSRQKRTNFTVHSNVWWNAGTVVRLPLEWKKDVRSLCGKISVQGEYGHTSERHFSERDLCGYVRSLLGVEGAIFNLIPIAKLLEMPEESMNQVTKCWKDEDEQLELILQHWSKKNDVVEDLATLRQDLESLKQEDYRVTGRGQMHIRHLRKLATKISGLQCTNADSMNYFCRKIKTLCKSVFRDCCIELEGSIEDVDRAASSTNDAEFFIHSIKIHQSLPEDVERNYQKVFLSSAESIEQTFLNILSYLIQNIKDIFVDERISEAPQNGLKGLPKEKLDHFVSIVRNAEGNNSLQELLYEVCNILEQLCLKNCEKQKTAEIKKWGESLAILPMLNFLEPFFQHYRHDVRLHTRLELFSRRLRSIMTGREDIDNVFIHDFSNVLLNVIHFAMLDPSKLVRFELGDSTNLPLICTRENVRYDKHTNTYSQVFRIKKESEGQLRLHAIAWVYINGKICKKGAFQSEIMLKASSEESFREYSSHFEDVTVVKLEDNDSENLRVILCATQKEKLSKLQDFLKQELRENVDLNQSEVTQCQLTMRTVTAKAGAVVNLRLVYKWGSEAVLLESKDFVQVANLSKERIVLDQQRTLTADKPPEDGSTIRENNVASREMQIFIKRMNGEKFPFTVKPNDLIKDVKKKVQQLKDCPFDRQRLVFAGKKLEDDHALGDYKVQNGSTLSLVQRLRDALMEDAS